MDHTTHRIGGALKAARERHGLTLTDVARATKINAATLHAIERDDFERLPGGIFRRGYLRAFATAVGEDGEAVVADYVAAIEPAPSADTVLALEAAEVREFNALRLRLAAIVVAMALVGAWWLVGRATSGPDHVATAPAQRALSAEDEERSDDSEVADEPVTVPLSHPVFAEPGGRL